MQLWWSGEEGEETAHCKMDRKLTKTANTYSSLNLTKHLHILDLNVGEGGGGVQELLFFPSPCLSNSTPPAHSEGSLLYVFWHRSSV